MEGGIEPGTFDLADEIAGKEFSFYSLSGIKINGNRILHIKSTEFDEPAVYIAMLTFKLL